MNWIHVSEKLPPEDTTLIGISSFCDDSVDWICIGKIDPAFKERFDEIEYRTNFITTVDVGVYCIKWWRPIPDIPYLLHEEWIGSGDWINCVSSRKPTI